MANFNKVILAGNLTRDPELRYTPKGTAIARITLALNRTWKSETGESKEEVTFVDIDSFGKQAETLAKYMKKGRPSRGGLFVCALVSLRFPSPSGAGCTRGAGRAP